MHKKFIAVLLTCPILLALPGCGSPDPSTTGATPSVEGSAASAAFAEAISAEAGKLTGEAKSRYEAALAADPFPQQQELIVGKWHGVMKDGAFESYYEYDRQPGGSLSHITIDMYGDEKEYLRNERTYSWKSTGRVIYEQDSAKPEMVYFLLLEEVSETGLKYKMIDPEIGYSEFSDNEDTRGPGTLPEMPEGWTQVDE